MTTIVRRLDTSRSVPVPTATIGPLEFAQAFPFHFVFDAGLRVVQVGASLSRIAPEVAPGALLSDSFSLARPARPLDAATLDTTMARLVLLEHHQSAVLFRGQFTRTADGRCWVFLGSPWFTTSDALESAGLTWPISRRRTRSPSCC